MGSEQRLDVSVVLPTYNESASLVGLVPRIAQALEDSQLVGEIVVVDDNSPDGTAEIAEQLRDRYPVRVIKRVQERGLATAVLTGFRSSEAAVCVVMDADGSHPVSALGGMVRMILEDKAEIVVGSRHVAGGGSKDWPLFSQLKSRFAASLAFGLSSMTDPTTGFMAIRRSLVERLDLDPVGWKIVLETVVKAHPARLAEVPIVFADREQGESKQSLSVLGQYLEHLYKLYKFRFPTFVELLKFCLVGAIGLLVDLSVVAALKQLANLDTRLCQVFGFGAAVSFNYAINRRYSFESARDTPVFSSYVAYVGANLVGLLVRMLAVHALILLTSLDQGRGYLLLSVLGILLATLVNFVGVKYFAFAPVRGRSVEPARHTPIPKELGPAPLQVGVTLGFILLAFAGLNLWDPTPRTHDERVNLTMAENIQDSFAGLVHPSVLPGIPDDWQRDALPLLGNTPVYPLLLAAVSWLGEPGLVLLSVSIFGLSLLATYSALSVVDRTAGRSAVMFFATSPPLFAQFSMWEFEPLVAAFSVLGFALLVRGAQRQREKWALLAGLALGLGFAVKLWLVLPGLAACLGFLVVQGRNPGPAAEGSTRKVLGMMTLGFCLTGLSHLAFVAITAPRDLLAWIDWVYLGVFSGRGVSGAKLSGGETSAWTYLYWLVRDHGALLPVFVLGLPALTRRVRELERGWFAAIALAALALIPLSVPSAKEPLYMLPALPFLYLLGGLSLVAPDRTPARYARVNRGAAQVAIALALGLAAAWLIAAVARPVAGVGYLACAAHMAIWTVPALRVLRQKAVAPVILPCALTSIGLAALLTVSGAPYPDPI